MLSGLLHVAAGANPVDCPEARYSALLYTRMEQLPKLSEIAGPDVPSGPCAQLVAVDEDFSPREGIDRLSTGRFVAVSPAGIIVQITVQPATRVLAHQWLMSKDELGFTAEDFAICLASRYEIAVDLVTPAPRPAAAGAVQFEAELIDRLALATRAAVLDVEAARFTSPVRRRVPDPVFPVDVREHIHILTSRDGDSLCMRTKGMVKFGCPEFDLRHVPDQAETIQLARATLADLAQHMATGVPAPASAVPGAVTAQHHAPALVN